MSKDNVMINRAPVLTLWSAVVAERLGFSEEEALSLGRAVAGLNAQAKGRCPLHRPERVFVYPQDRDKIVRKAHEGRGHEAIREIPAEGENER